MKTAVIGTGIMGAGVAGSLAREGHDVVVWNRTRERAEKLVGERITVADTVAEAVADAEVVLTVLFDADAVLEVADDLVAHLAEGAVWLQCATVGPDHIRRIAEHAGHVGGRMIDAPMLGTRAPAEQGTLVMLASGPADLIATAQPALDAIGSRTVVAGDEIGQASALKLACNAWIATITAGTAQSLALAEALGVEPQLFLDAIKGGAADSPYAHVKGKSMLSGEHPPSFALDGLRKDLSLMVTAAQSAGLRDDLLGATLGVFDDAAEAGHGGDDIAAVAHAFDRG